MAVKSSFSNDGVMVLDIGETDPLWSLIDFSKCCGSCHFNSLCCAPNKGCNLLLRTLVHPRADGVVKMISLNALSSRRSPFGEVLHQVVCGCSSRRTMYHHRSSPFSACDSQSTGSDKPKEVCLSTKDATSIVGCNSGFHIGKRSKGKVSLRLCSLTIWYNCYALTLHMAEPDPAYAWHSELNTSLGTTTRNHDSEPRLGTTTRNQPIRFGRSSHSLIF